MKTYKILLVDDDADDQYIFLDAISSLDHSLQCEVANNGIEAIDHLNKIPPPPSVIFLDLNMPKMNGYECLQEIKKMKDFKEIPVVIFSTSNALTDKERTKKLGAKVFLTKTSDFKKLRSNISEILNLELN